LSQVAAAWRGQAASIETTPLLVRPRGTGVAALARFIPAPTMTNRSQFRCRQRKKAFSHPKIAP
jgi:hypothetical protein